MLFFRSFGLFVLGCALVSSALAGPALVTPMMGGGQVAAEMVHIDIYYDAEVNQLHAVPDESAGKPRLRPLDPGFSFDAPEPYGVLEGKAYNSQYGWNVGGFFMIPPGTAIWIELIDASPGLETYEGWGRSGSYAPILGTAGTSRLWKWNGVMVHNTYAVRGPMTELLYAEYHVFLGDAETGSRVNFMDLDDTTVRLEWTAEPVENPLTFEFGAAKQADGAPLLFLNASRFVTNSQRVINLRETNGAADTLPYECRLSLVTVSAPATNAPTAGSKLELELQSVAGPAQATFKWFEFGGSAPPVSMTVGASAATNRFALSTTPDSRRDIRVAVSRPGLYCLGFRLTDTSTNGPGSGPLHAASPFYSVFFQAGLTIASIEIGQDSGTVVFGGDPGRAVYLERTTTLGPAPSWETAAGPVIGTNILHTLTDSASKGPSRFYRLRAL